MAVIRDIIRESVRLETLSGAELSRGRFTVTPVARSLTIGRLPAGALEGDGAVFFRWIWPSAVLVTEDGQTSRVPIVDVTQAGPDRNRTGCNGAAVRDLHANKSAKGAMMDAATNDLMQGVRQEAEARSQALQKLLSGADSSRVFGQPVTTGEYTVIPAAQIASGGGFGSGMGFGGPRWKGRHGTGQPGEAPEAETEGVGAPMAAVEGGGGGGGGGGGAMGRPVAVIVLGPDGVQVKPVTDTTWVAIAALGAFGVVATALSASLRRRR